MLFHGPAAEDVGGGPLLPSWMNKGQVDERMNVWMAIERLEMNNSERSPCCAGTPTPTTSPSTRRHVC